MNITDIEDGFSQVEGTRYWVVLSCTSPSGYVGWLTTLSTPWGSRARYWDPDLQDWIGLYTSSVNMSFVITKDGPSNQACCFENGSCDYLEPEECLQQGGTPQGPGTNCSTVTCPQPPEACCFEDGTCEELDPSICQAQEGMPQGPESTCAMTYCEQFTEACCFVSGWCDDLRLEDCLEIFGTPQGPGTKCENMECPALSANKWEQLPDPCFAGIPASTYCYFNGEETVAAALWVGDDWVCTGGDVTALRWWGYYPVGSPGGPAVVSWWRILIQEPHTVHPNIPADQFVHWEDALFSEVSEVDTGMVSSTSGSPPIYEYTYQLKEPFEQVEGQRYFLVLRAFLHECLPMSDAWCWQRHNISSEYILYPAVMQEEETLYFGPWLTLTDTDMAFTIISECIVDFELYAKFAEQWLDTGTGLSADLHKDAGNIVDFFDLDVFTDEWLDYCPYEWSLKNE